MLTGIPNIDHLPFALSNSQAPSHVNLTTYNRPSNADSSMFSSKINLFLRVRLGMLLDLQIPTHARIPTKDSAKLDVFFTYKSAPRTRALLYRGISGGGLKRDHALKTDLTVAAGLAD